MKNLDLIILRGGRLHKDEDSRKVGVERALNESELEDLAKKLSSK